MKKAKSEALKRKCSHIRSMIGGSRSKEAWNTINWIRKNIQAKYRVNLTNKFQKLQEMKSGQTS